MDHAGEFGVDKICAGQLAVLGPIVTGSLPFVPTSGRKVPAKETGALIQHMWDQEKEQEKPTTVWYTTIINNIQTMNRIRKLQQRKKRKHLAVFERLIPKHRARPTALLPIWNIAGVHFIYSNNINSTDSHNCRNY